MRDSRILFISPLRFSAHRHVPLLGERGWFVLERPRRDTNGGSETEVTVTSKQPSKYRKKQGEKRETEKRREGRIRETMALREGRDDERGT